MRTLWLHWALISIDVLPWAPSKFNGQMLAEALSESGINDKLNREVCHWLESYQQDCAYRMHGTQPVPVQHDALITLIQSLDKALSNGRVPATKGILS